MLAWLSAVRDKDLIGRLTAWDGQLFLDIARHGYTFSTDAGTKASPALFPGYPTLAAALHRITGSWLGAYGLTIWPYAI